MLFFRERYYDPSIGRFTSEDPLAMILRRFPISFRYAYVDSNPIIARDPTGMIIECTTTSSTDREVLEAHNNPGNWVLVNVDYWPKPDGDVPDTGTGSGEPIENKPWEMKVHPGASAFVNAWAAGLWAHQTCTWVKDGSRDWLIDLVTTTVTTCVDTCTGNADVTVGESEAKYWEHVSSHMEAQTFGYKLFPFGFHVCEQLGDLMASGPSMGSAH